LQHSLAGQTFCGNGRGNSLKLSVIMGFSSHFAAEPTVRLTDEPPSFGCGSTAAGQGVTGVGARGRSRTLPDAFAMPFIGEICENSATLAFSCI